MYRVHWLLLVFLVVVVTSSAPSSSEAEEAWKNFKLTHGREYRNLREEAARKAIFVANFNQIVAHNKLFEAGSATYSMNINRFADLTREEIDETYKGNRQGTEHSDIEIIRFVPDQDAEIAEEFDWREKGAVTAIKNQGDCGSCWAFTTTGALEGQYFLKTGKLVSLSEQNLVDCSTEYKNYGCNGGSVNAAFTYVHDLDAIDSEEFYPYEAVKGTCRYDVSANVTSLKGYATIERGQEDHLKAAIATIGPIAIGFDASHDGFNFYEGGIYYDEKCTDGGDDPEYRLNHAMLAIGYGTEDGQDYWLLKNSYGEDWGDKGYIKVARNRDNNCGVAAMASFPLNY